MSQEQSTSETQLYYLQDTRSYTGNSMVWWAKNCQGYVCDVRNAQVFTKEEAFSRHNGRRSDLPWRKDYIDARLSHHVDMQCVERDDPEAQ